MPKVWNKYDRNCPKDAVNVMRPSKWGNPFSHQPQTTAKFRVATREEAVHLHREWLCHDPEAQHLRDSIEELRGKDLVCCCAPLACHADFLLRAANKHRPPKP